MAEISSSSNTLMRERVGLAITDQLSTMLLGRSQGEDKGMLFDAILQRIDTAPDQVALLPELPLGMQQVVGVAIERAVQIEPGFETHVTSYRQLFGLAAAEVPGQLPFTPDDLQPALFNVA